MNAITQIVTQQLGGSAARTIAQLKRQVRFAVVPSGLSNFLNSQQQEAKETAPDAMSVLNSMLDQNKDGSSMDDLKRMAASFFK